MYIFLPKGRERYDTTGNAGASDLLREDCRLPLEKLAVMLGVSTEEVAETIDSLERRRVILHYAPTINWDLTDRERVEAMIQVSVTPQRDMGFDAVARRIYRFEEVKSVYLMSRRLRPAGAGGSQEPEGTGAVRIQQAVYAGNGHGHANVLRPQALQGRGRHLRRQPI